MAAATERREREAVGPVDQSGILGDWRTQIAHLQANGWRCLGNPEWPTSMWLDPEKPLKPHYTEEPVMYDAEVREEYTDPRDGQRKVKYTTEKRAVLAQDGRGGALVAAKRWVFHPAVTPLGVTEALRTQMERDAAKQVKALAEREAEKK